ncbi:hypothetical protein IIA16_04545 [bacterium]|nr:hypothetical protein [bacterium]
MKRLLPLVGLLLLTVSAGPDEHGHQDPGASAQMLAERTRGMRLRLLAGQAEASLMAPMASLTPEQMEEVKAWLATAPEFLQGHVGQMLEMMHGGMMGPGGGHQGAAVGMMEGSGMGSMHGPQGMMGMGGEGGAHVIMRRLLGGSGMGFAPPEGWECEREMEDGELEVECEWEGGDAPHEMPFGDGWECEREMEDGELEISCTMESGGALGQASGMWRGMGGDLPFVRRVEVTVMDASDDVLDVVRRAWGRHSMSMGAMGSDEHRGRPGMGMGMDGPGGPPGRRGGGRMGPGGPQVVPFPGGIVVLFGGQGQGQHRGAMMEMGGGMHQGMMEMMERMHGPDGMMEMGGGMMEMMERMHGPDGMREMGGGMMEMMERMHGPDGMMGMGGPQGRHGRSGPQVIPFRGGVVILFGSGPPPGFQMGGGMGMMGRDDMVMHTPDGEMFDPRIHLDARPGDGDRSPLAGGAARHGYPL